MFCPNCGKEIEHPGAFCMHCGARLPDAIKEKLLAQKQPEAPEAEPAETIVEKTHEAPAAEETPEVPAAPEQPDTPAEEETPEAPAAEETPETPAAPAESETSAAPETPKTKAPVNAPAAAPMSQAPKKKTGLIIAIAVVVVLALSAAVLLPKLTAPKELNFELADYLNVDYDGFDGYAHATFELDRNKLMRDICALRKVDPSFLDGSVEPPKKIEAAYATVQMLEPYAEYGEDIIANPYYGEDEMGLKNGDVMKIAAVSFSELPDEDIHVKSAEITVSGLQSVPKADPFEGFRLEFDEYSISGRNLVWGFYEGDLEGLYDYSFEIDPMINVKNGDTVTVRLSGDAELYEREYGFSPSVTEKTFTVEGLPQYVSSFDEISKVALQALKDRTLEEMREELQELDSDVAYTEPICIGYAFTKEADPDKAENNALYLVFRSDIDDGIWSVPQPYFYAEKYQEILNTDDAAETAWKVYNGTGIVHVAGAYMVGFSDPWEYIGELITSAADEGQEISFGGEVAAYSDGDGKISALSDISAEAMEKIKKYTADSIVYWIEKDGGTIRTAPEYLGAYFLWPTNTNKPDNDTLLLLYRAAYQDADGAEHDVYVPYEYSGVRTVLYGLLIEDEIGLMADTIGYDDFDLLHQALLVTGENLGKIEVSDSIKALAG